MSVQTALAIALVAGLGAAQYIFMVQALRDLARRPRVRGGNKVAWSLLILCVPIIGALVYGWMGPTSLVRRTHGPAEQHTDYHPVQHAGRIPMQQNITPISQARKRRTATSPRPQGNKAPPRRFTRTGS